MASFLLQPNADFARRLSTTRAALGFEGPVVGVHVRNGDYCSFKASGLEGGQLALATGRDVRGMHRVLRLRDEGRLALKESGLEFLSLGCETKAALQGTLQGAYHVSQSLVSSSL